MILETLPALNRKPFTNTQLAQASWLVRFLAHNADSIPDEFQVQRLALVAA